MRRFLLGALTVLIIAVMIVNTGVIRRIDFGSWWGNGSKNGISKKQKLPYMVTNGIKYRMKVEGNSFLIYEKGNWESVFLKGVNIGATKPGIFPGELTISYEEYYRWFEMIGRMNANCIRVYTTMRPQFYNALLDYNQKAEKPLYLFQTVWMNEADIQSLFDAYAQNEKIKNDFTQDALNVIDVLQGNITLPLRPGFASGNYTADVSDYVAGIMLGIEWDPKFVMNTNNNNPQRNMYDGDYLYTLNATPFETFLCSVGDEVIRYQTEKYSYQMPVAFTNWVTTDPLSHPNEPHPDEDRVSVNMENIKSRKEYLPGMFLSYHVYPYYPDVLNYEKDYINYVDPYGKKNPYRAYLKELKSIHTMPIVIAEFGIPTSRGRGHESVMGYHQGFIDETEQGAMLVDMMRSMYEENYAGGLVFTWQDEWFKRTWNNVAFDVPDSRPFWSNIQTNEQNFGILSFDPGAESVCLIDGDISEWGDSSPVIVGNAGSLYIKSDERYMYLMIKTENFDFEKDTLYIPIDTIENQGNLFLDGTRVTFDRPADFLITINGTSNTRITVDSYYDAFYYLFGEQYKMLPLIGDIRTKNSGRFHTMQMCYNYELTVPDTKTVVPFRSYETGKLLYGISNPDSPEYKSLADFYHKDNVIELRIPWQLLNVMDPSTRRIMDDLYTMQSIVPTKTSGFYFGLAKKPAADEQVTVRMNVEYIWDTWILPKCRERLKPSYKVLQQALPAFK